MEGVEGLRGVGWLMWAVARWGKCRRLRRDGRVSVGLTESGVWAEGGSRLRWLRDLTACGP